MTTSISLARHGNPIRNLAEWEVAAPPKGKQAQWQDGRSAKELARAWTRLPNGPTPPEEFTRLLQGHPAFKDIVVISGTPEDRVRFDDLPGEPRNADLNLLCRCPTGPVVVSIEAKADEPFGGTVAQALKAAAKRIAAGKRSNGVARTNALLGRLLPGRAPVPLDLAYQLLCAGAALLSLANKHHATAALLLIHEFVNARRRDGRPATSVRKLTANADRLDAFVSAISGGTTLVLPSGTIVGPFATRWASAPLFVGKLRTDLGA